MAAVLADMRERRAVIVWLDRLAWRGYFPTGRELLLHHPLQPVRVAADGVVFTARRAR